MRFRNLFKKKFNHVRRDGWIVLYSKSQTHVIPLYDLNDHYLNTKCSCKPEIEEFEETDNILVKHNSYDGLHILEEFELMLKPGGTEF